MPTHLAAILKLYLVLSANGWMFGLRNAATSASTLVSFSKLHVVLNDIFFPSDKGTLNKLSSEDVLLLLLCVHDFP